MVKDKTNLFINRRSGLELKEFIVPGTFDFSDGSPTPVPRGPHGSYRPCDDGKGTTPDGEGSWMVHRDV